MRGNLRTRKAVKRGSHVLARLAATESRSQLNLFCRHPWLLAWPHATNLELSAARPPTLRVCARAVRATRRPRAHGSLPHGQPSAPCGLHIRAYGSPLARSASGRVTSRHVEGAPGGRARQDRRQADRQDPGVMLGHGQLVPHRHVRQLVAGMAQGARLRGAKVPRAEAYAGHPASRQRRGREDRADPPGACQREHHARLVRARHPGEGPRGGRPAGSHPQRCETAGQRGRRGGEVPRNVP